MHTSANGTHGFFTTFSLVTRQQDLPPQAGETSQHGGEAFFLVAFWYVCKDTMNRTWHIGEVVRWCADWVENSKLELHTSNLPNRCKFGSCSSSSRSRSLVQIGQSI